MSNRLELTNLTFGRLTVLKPTDERNGSAIVWLCRCSCSENTIIKVPSRRLRNGDTQSCGCLHKETIARINYKHGASKSKYKDGNRQIDYIIWTSIKSRCYNKNNKRFKDYGGRGIKMSSKWKDNFIKFAEYIRTLDNCPSEKVLISRLKGKRLQVSIDRIKNSGNYCAGNLKWSTCREQSNNRRSNIMIKYKGENLTLKEAVDKHSILPYHTVYSRLKLDWSIKDALTVPSQRTKL